MIQKNDQTLCCSHNIHFSEAKQVFQNLSRQDNQETIWIMAERDTLSPLTLHVQGDDGLQQLCRDHATEEGVSFGDEGNHNCHLLLHMDKLQNNTELKDELNRVKAQLRTRANNRYDTPGTECGGTHNQQQRAPRAVLQWSATKLGLALLCAGLVGDFVHLDCVYQAELRCVGLNNALEPRWLFAILSH
jgi:hypothetical protein